MMDFLSFRRRSLAALVATLEPHVYSCTVEYFSCPQLYREEWEGNMFCSNWQQYANMFMNFIPVVPHKAVAEVSSRGKL